MFRAATTVRAFGLAFAMGAVLVSPAAGATVYGLIGNDRIVTFAAANPGTIKSDFAISGLDPGEVLTGIDIRPLDGKIYSVTTGGRVYRLDRGAGRYIATFTGVVTTFPFPGTLVPITGSNFGIDFAPFDRIRLVSDFDQNLRINPLNGGAAIDAPINDGAGQSPYDLVGVAFADGSAVGAPFYGIDGLSSSLLLGAPGGVYRNTNPAGAAFDALGISLASQSEVGFDILFAGGINRAFLSAFDSFYRIDLTTGRATLIGDIGISDIRDITAAAYVPEPPTWALMLVGFGMIASLVWRRRSGTSMIAKCGLESRRDAARMPGRRYRTQPAHASGPMFRTMRTACLAFVAVAVATLFMGVSSGPVQAQMLRIWGDDSSRQISSAPDGDVNEVAGGAIHSLALRSDKTPVLWGSGPIGPPPIPAALSAERFKAIALGRDDAVLLQLDGTLAAFGRNAPIVSVPAGFYKAISVGTAAAVAIGDDGRLTAWGLDRYPPVNGALTGLLSAPKGGPFKAVESILLYSLALHEDGTLYGWGTVGSNSTNVLAGWTPTLEDPTIRYVPGETFKAISAGNVHALAIRPNGTVTGWGNGSGGALDPPTHVRFKAIDAGWGYSIGLSTGGTLWGWGTPVKSPFAAQSWTFASQGWHRYGDSQHYYIPNERFKSISAGAFHVMAITAGRSPDQ